jgi:hypothetical protein
MIKYKTISYSNEETFHYQLIEKVIFVTGKELGKWELRTPDNIVVAKSLGSVVIVYPGYMWDGSTIIGEYYEDKVTLEASLIHDVLYNAKKNPEDIKVSFSLFTADSIFRDYLKLLYNKNKGSFFQKYIFPELYKWGLWIFGLPWKFSNNKFYRLKPSKNK